MTDGPAVRQSINQSVRHTDRLSASLAVSQSASQPVNQTASLSNPSLMFPTKLQACVLHRVTNLTLEQEMNIIDYYCEYS